MVVSLQKNIRFVVAPAAVGTTAKRIGQVRSSLRFGTTLRAAVMMLYASATDQAHQDHDDGDDQQDMDETADGVGSYQTEQPQNDKNDGNCVEHDSVLMVDRRCCAVIPVSN
jgi:hypothetical protein